MCSILFYYSPFKTVLQCKRCFLKSGFVHCISVTYYFYLLKEQRKSLETLWSFQALSLAEWVGFEPTWAINPNAFRVRPVMTTSIPLLRSTTASRIMAYFSIFILLGQGKFHFYKSAVLYQIPRICCMNRLTPEMPSQQQSPIKIGLPPVFTNFTRLVLRPIAAIAIMIRNLLNSLIG